MPASALPWKEILRGATLAVSLAGNLIKGSSSRPKAPPQATTQPAPDPQAQLAALARRIESLESSTQEQAKVVQLLAEEVQNLTRRAMTGYRIGIAGVVLALAALAVAFLR
jgi:hypothetical protein